MNMEIAENPNEIHVDRRLQSVHYYSRRWKHKTAWRQSDVSQTSVFSSSASVCVIVVTSRENILTSLALSTGYAICCCCCCCYFRLNAAMLQASRPPCTCYRQVAIIASTAVVAAAIMPTASWKYKPSGPIDHQIRDGVSEWVGFNVPLNTL